MSCHSPLSSLCIVLSLCAGFASADDFPELKNSEADQTAQPMPADEAAAGFVLPEGFQVDVFASEPDVQNPIAMTWDSKGRLWIAENFTYAERSQRFDLSLRDRVLVFEDTDHDGKADVRKVFTDNVQMLTSIEVGHGGVWLMCPSQLLFLPDADADDVPDGSPVVVLDGFEVAKDNYHNYANGLRWGPDGWLYGRCGGSCPGRIGKPGTPDEQRVALEGGIWRYHPVSKTFEVLCHGTTNPWGHDWNQYGDGFFVNTVNGHLWQIIPGAHYMRPFTLDPNPHTYQLIDMHADHWHFDTGASWTKSRDGAANSFGGGHAHSGASIYLGDNWPDQYRGQLLTLNFHGRRMNQENLNRKGSGYSAGHGKDLFVASDPFFRGMDLSYGPDGAVYVLDWSDTGECHEHTGVHRTSGRIYRVSWVGTPVQTNSEDEDSTQDLRSLSSDQLLSLLQKKNEWHVRQAKIILAERTLAGQGLTAPQTRLLNEMIQQGPSGRSLRALTTLHVCGALSADLLIQLANRHYSEHIRSQALHLLTDQWPIDDIFGPTYQDEAISARIRAEVDAAFPDLLQIAESDTSAKVQLTLASILQRLPTDRRCRLAAKIMSHQEFADDHNLPLMVWYGLMPVAERHADEFASTAVSSRWPKTQRLITRRLAEQINSHPKAIDLVLEQGISRSPQVQANILQGLADGLKGLSKCSQPHSWPAFFAAVQKQRDADLNAVLTDLSVVFGDGRALDEVRAIVQNSEAEINLRRSALKTLVATNDPEVADICLPLLADARLNTFAAKGVARRSSAEIAAALVKNYRRFRSPNRAQVIEILSSRPIFAKALLDAVAAGKIAASDLTAFDVRQIRSLNDPELTEKVASVWGDIRETSEARKERIESLKAQLTQDTLRSASAGKGRAIFNRSCSKCHRMFGFGESIGPDLTGANRTNLDYLLENIVAPSAVVSKDYRMSIVELNSGQVLNGLVTSKNTNTLTLQTQNELRTIALADIEEVTLTKLSPMPDGLLDNLTPAEVTNLMWYLMQPVQVAPEGSQDNKQDGRP